MESNDGQKATATFGHRVAVLGYGAEARAQALNLRALGKDVAVAVRPGGMSWVRAIEDGFRPCHVAEAVAGADVIVMLVPEVEQPALYSQSVAPHAKPGALLVLGHASAVHAQAVEPAPESDVVLVTVRLDESGVKCFVAVHHDATGAACTRAIAYARAAYGAASASVGTTTFAEETEREVAEQAACSGGVGELLAAWEKLLTSHAHEPNDASLSYYENLRAVVAKTGVQGIPSPPASQLHVGPTSETIAFGPATFRSRQRGAA